MNVFKVIWPQSIRVKLASFNSQHYTANETHDFIIQLILETEDLLLNPVFDKAYTEESGQYKGVSRIVVRKFKMDRNRCPH
jgi:hypothetical protein